MMHVNPSINALLQRIHHPSLPGIDLSLARMETLLATLGNPQWQLPPVVHLAGTNGKGSTLAFMQAMLGAMGYRVHSYTSPHLVRFNERIVLNGEPIADAALEPLLQQVLDTRIDATFFEATTAAAFLAFAQTPADYVLLETGLGGRLDATNMVPDPAVTVITPINFDHMEFLGTTLAAIAAEKAGILKPGRPCVAGVQAAEANAVLTARAQDLTCPLFLAGRDWHYRHDNDGVVVQCGASAWRLPLPSLPGPHQIHNAALASVALHVLLPQANDTAWAAVADTHWPARLQRLRHGPLVEGWAGPVYLDGGHNTHAAQALAAWIGDGQVAMLCGMMRRKDAAAFLAALAGRVARLVAVPIPGEDAYAPEELAMLARAQGLEAAAATDYREALALLQGCHSQPLLITGSLFLAGEILKTHG